MMFPPSAWFGSGGEALATEKRVNSAALEGDPPVEPGGFSVGRILQQIQLGVEGLVEIKNEVLRAGQGAAKKSSEGREYNPGLGESGQDSRTKREAAHKAMDALNMRIQRHLGETWRPGDDGPILAKVGGANLPIDGGGTGSDNRN